MSGMRNRFAPHIDFGFLKGVIPSNPKFMPSNIDMVLERKGQFLFGEWKREGEEMSQGQKILLKELSWNNHVILITGYVDENPHISLIQEIDPIESVLKTVGKSVDDLKVYINKWYEKAENDGFTLHR